MIEKQHEAYGDILISTILFEDRQFVLHNRLPSQRYQRCRNMIIHQEARLLYSML